MKKYLFSFLLFFSFSIASCNKDDSADIANDQTPEQQKFDIISVWEDSSGNKENIVSFAKDGTYKIIFKQNYDNNLYFISTGRYVFDESSILCQDNCTESASKKYKVSTTKDGFLIIDNRKLRRVGIEANAHENKLSGLNLNFGGYTISQNYKKIGECNYFMQFTNDYRAYKIIEKIYYEDKSKSTTNKTLYHYVFYDNYLYLAEDGDSYSPRYTYDPQKSNCIYYIDNNGQVKLP